MLAIRILLFVLPIPIPSTQMAAPKPLELVVLPAVPGRDGETITRFWALVSSVPRLTVVCGAGVSTGSGIPVCTFTISLTYPVDPYLY